MGVETTAHVGESLETPLLSVVVPCYNESDALDPFFARLCPVLEPLDCRCEVIAVNDGSRDDTLSRLRDYQTQLPYLRVIDLSRNFGKEAALTAGLDHAQGDAVVVIDVDLQDPPELIRDFVAQWQAGYEVVYGARADRSTDTWLKRNTARAFYWVIRRLSRVSIPRDAGDFRLMTRPVVDALRHLREHHRFMKGIFSWVGFRQTAVYYQREARSAGETKFNYWRLWNFALEGITSFSQVPLQVATYVGMLIALGALVYGFSLIVYFLMGGETVAGYPSLMVVMLFLGGVQLMTLGVMGEYIGRIYNETKQRPLYVIREVSESGQSAEHELAETAGGQNKGD